MEFNDFCFLDHITFCRFSIQHKLLLQRILWELKFDCGKANEIDIKTNFEIYYRVGAFFKIDFKSPFALLLISDSIFAI